VPVKVGDFPLEFGGVFSNTILPRDEVLVDLAGFVEDTAMVRSSEMENGQLVLDLIVVEGGRVSCETKIPKAGDARDSETLTVPISGSVIVVGGPSLGSQEAGGRLLEGDLSFRDFGRGEHSEKSVAQLWKDHGLSRGIGDRVNDGDHLAPSELEASFNGLLVSLVLTLGLGGGGAGSLVTGSKSGNKGGDGCSESR